MERNVVKLICLMNKVYPPVAKLDIAVDSDSKGRGFESLRADQMKNTCKPCIHAGLQVFFYFPGFPG